MVDSGYMGDSVSQFGGEGVCVGVDRACNACVGSLRCVTLVRISRAVLTRVKTCPLPNK